MAGEKMVIRYWGVRGSLPAPLSGQQVRDKNLALLERVMEEGGTEKLFGAGSREEKRERIRQYLAELPLSLAGTFGGNTTCVEVQVRDAPLIIFDSGSGIRKLGDDLLCRFLRDEPLNPLSSELETRRDIHLFLTHFHWDHLNGIPLFKPAFFSRINMVFYGRKNTQKSIGDVLAGQQETPNFPVVWEDMPCNKFYVELPRMGTSIKHQPGNPSYEPARIRYQELTHPDAVYAYRVDLEERAFVFATDHEHKDIVDPRLLKLATGADVLYYDGQFTPEEYGDPKSPKLDWGHSTYEWGVRTALAAGNKTLVIGHHDTDRDDFGIEWVQSRARRFLDEQLKLPENRGKELELLFAYEGLEHRLG